MIDDDRRIFTLIHTSCDADNCDFPPVDVIGSWINAEAAYDELKNCIDRTKLELIDDEEEIYNEDKYTIIDEGDFWEINMTDYAMGWFIRYEIIISYLQDGVIKNG